MKELLNCPNCGAPIESEKCPYCGSVFIDFASMDMDKPFYLKIKHREKVMTCRAIIDQAELSTRWIMNYALYTPTIGLSRPLHSRQSTILMFGWC